MGVKKHCFHDGCDQKFNNFSDLKKHCASIHECDGRYVKCPNERKKLIQIIADPDDIELIEALKADGRLEGKSKCPHVGCFRWIVDMSKHLNSFNHNSCPESSNCQQCSIDMNRKNKGKGKGKEIGQNQQNGNTNRDITTNNTNSNNNRVNNSNLYSSDEEEEEEEEGGEEEDAEDSRSTDYQSDEDETQDKEEEEDDDADSDYEDDETIIHSENGVAPYLAPGVKFDINTLRCVHMSCGWVSHGQLKNLKYHCKIRHSCSGKPKECPNNCYKQQILKKPAAVKPSATNKTTTSSSAYTIKKVPFPIQSSKKTSLLAKPKKADINNKQNSPSLESPLSVSTPTNDTDRMVIDDQINNSNQQYKFILNDSLVLEKVVKQSTKKTVHKCLHLNCGMHFGDEQVKSHLYERHDCPIDQECSGCQLMSFYQLY